LVLTIDKNIQYIVEKELEAAVSLSQARGGIAVAMDPWTGEILASAVAPQFNPNQYADAPPEAWRNRAVTDVFEPGSTFKTFLVSSALEEGVVKPTDSFFCENGSYVVSKRIIHDVHSYGWLDVANIIKHSSNIGASKIGRQLGKEQLYRYIKKFGFTEETGVKFPSEAAGYLPPLARCSDHTQSTISFGQGISVTPLQMVTAYSAIANGGMLMRPLLVKKVVDCNGMVVQDNVPLARWRVISEETARTMRQILENVVLEGGTGTKAAVAGFTVAGKTGTSQKIEDAGYSHSKVIASFAGFVPADNPRVTIVVLIDEPQKMKYGGEIAAPAFSRMAHGILNYLHVVPESILQNPPARQNGPKTWQETKTTSAKGEQLG
ncbi:MAG: penicillin-binding protein 2, partial [Pseudomonadota bacterium]